ncbi:aminotransferase class I/II-fold pyridoxal phosphate-dependent enzyme [Ensifer sp. LBL]|uniref:aminotransferase class I/II-fold pyridoxal phosphate-dependent enzyme n=1 Tax=Ensifer sp. LBL TaxID=2991056 RepID=UPI003D234597
MTSSVAHDGMYQHFVWTLPPADPEAWLAALIALHQLFDGAFTAKTWLCRWVGGGPPAFSSIELAQLTDGPISLVACHRLVRASDGAERNTLGQGEHVIVFARTAVDLATVERWHPRTALVLEATENRDNLTVTYIQRRGVIDPGFPAMLERAVNGLVPLTRRGVDDTADIAATIRAVLPTQAVTPKAVETAPDLFIHRFSALAAQAPDRSAIITADTRMSYGELARASDSLVHNWRRLAFAKGDRLMVIAPRGPVLVVTVLAAFKAGLAICLADPRQPPAYVATCRRIVRPALVIDLSGRDLAPPGVPAVTAIDLTLDAAAPPICTDRFEGDDCAIITLTSGTTREPKAVLGRYSSLTRFFDWMDDRFGPMADAAFGMCSSIGHDPLQRDIMTPLYLGGRIVIPDERDLSEPQRLPRWLASNRVEFVCLNAALVPWLGSSAHLPHLRALFCVGGALTRSQAVTLRAAVPQARIVNLYGATETQRAVGFYEVPSDPDALAELPEIVPLGRGMKDVDLIVRDVAHWRLTLPFQVGEIALRSRHLALGYAGDPELTARKFRHDIVPEPDDVPTYLTGDLGYVSASYGVVFTGRMDDQIKISGYRIELAAIDDMCRQHPAIENAATLVLPIDGLPTLVTCFVPWDAAEHDGIDGLRQWLAQRLPHYMVPHRLCAMGELPLTLNRKIDAQALTAHVRSEIGLDETNVSAPATALLDRIVAFVHRHTGQDDPAKDLALADLGIDSLRFVELTTQLSGETGGGPHGFDGFHNGMSIADLASALADRGMSRLGRSSPVAPLSPRRVASPQTRPRDLLGSVLDVTETDIRFAQGAFDHCCSNSYLGIAGRPEIRAQIARFLDQSGPHGAHGSAELNGFTTWHEQLVMAVKVIHGSEAALLYGSGYLANISAISAVVEGDAHLFVDEDCHQSIVDGCRLSGARITTYRHNDASNLESLLSATPRSGTERRAIVTEGVFSIEGDVLDLPAIHAIARRFDCLLIVDEGCSLGLLGIDGAGVESHFGLPGSIDIRTGTLAKAIGSTGGYVTCRLADMARLRFHRAASFSTSLSPLNAFIALQGARLLRLEGRALKARLDRNAALWREGLNALGFDTARSATAIVPLLCAGPDDVAALFQRALRLGVYALPVSSPWSRRVNGLRTSVTAAHRPDRLREIIGRFAADASGAADASFLRA